MTAQDTLVDLVGTHPVMDWVALQSARKLGLRFEADEVLPYDQAVPWHAGPHDRVHVSLRYLRLLPGSQPAQNWTSDLFEPGLFRDELPGGAQAIANRVKRAASKQFPISKSGPSSTPARRATTSSSTAPPSASTASCTTSSSPRARARPIIIQSLFLRMHGQPMPPEELAEYCFRLEELVHDGAQIKEVHLYTIARPTPEPFCGKLTKAELEVMVATVREKTGLKVVTFD